MKTGRGFALSFTLNVCVSIFLPGSDQAVFQLALAHTFSSLKNDAAGKRAEGAVVWPVIPASAGMSRTGCFLQERDSNSQSDLFYFNNKS